MERTKKVAGNLLAIGVAICMAVNVGFAQVSGTVSAQEKSDVTASIEAKLMTGTAQRMANAEKPATVRVSPDGLGAGMKTPDKKQKLDGNGKSAVQAPTLYWDGSAWQPIPPNFTVLCTGGGTRCTATGTPSNPQNIVPGTATLIPNP